jgi:hypothetical protein
MAAIDILKQILAKRRPAESVQAEQIPLGTTVQPQQEQTVTLGGDQPINAPSPMATRPRVVPEKPVADVVPAASIQGDDIRMADSLMATKPGVMATPEQPALDLSNPRQRARYIENKDYSIQKDPDGNIIHRGADRDKKWSLGDKVGSFIMGMFDGTGGVNAAMDRNYMEKRQDKRDLGEAYGSINRQQAVEKGDAEAEQRRLNNEWMAVRPDLEQQKIDNKAADDQRDYEIKARTQGWKEADRVEYYRLEREKLDALKSNRSDLYQLAVRRQTELERHNKSTEGQAARNELGRNARASMSQQGMSARQQLSIAAQEKALQVRDAMKRGQMDVAQQHKKELAALKEQYDQAPE